MKITLFTVFLLISAIGFSQKDSLNPLGYGKHSVSVNFSTILPALIGAKRQSVNSYNIQYRRTLKKFNLKASFNYSHSDNFGFGPQKYYSEIIMITDTTILTRHETRGDKMYDIRLGIEKRLGNKKINWIIGGDIILGYRKKSAFYTDVSKNYYSDNFGNFDTWSNYPNYTTVDYFEIDEYGQVNGIKNETYIQIGLDVNFGVEFKLSRRLNLAILIIPKFTYNLTNKSDIKDAKGYWEYNTFFNFGQFQPGYFDINLSYKFGGMKKGKS